MVFKDIQIKNFRGIKHLEIKGLKEINLLGGKNNSGKTSVLEALQILARPFDFEHYTALNLMREYGKEEENIDLFFYELDKKNEVLIQDRSLNRTVLILDNQLVNNTYTQNLQNIILAISNQEITYHYHDDRNIYVIQKQSELKNLPKNNSFRTIFLHSTQNFLPDLPQQIKRIKIEKEIKKIIDILHQVDPRIVEIDIFDEVIFIDIGLKRLIPIQLAGDGLKRILSIVVGMYKAKGGIILIDEVDVGLHYSVQEIMWQAVWKASEEFGVQVVATTHSTDCIAAFTQTAEQNKGNRANYYRLDRHENEHKAVLYDQALLSTAMTENFEIR